jgi:hypothetical protein
MKIESISVDPKDARFILLEMSEPLAPAQVINLRNRGPDHAYTRATMEEIIRALKASSFGQQAD